MVTLEEIEARSALAAESTDLNALRERLVQRTRQLIAQMPEIPRVKALLSRDGGVCSEDGAPLVFNPWSPQVHACSRCGREHRGERHDRHWARFQHLWVAERAAELATVAALDADAEAADRAREILTAYRGYAGFPNRDNVLGPARLFFSTYLESIWITNYLAAASLLREAGLLDEDLADIVGNVADEAATLIGEFDEGFSNRQTWHNAALAAVAVWFEDEELAERALAGGTGLMAHLAHGFAEDGTWYEGENYHLFALQGLLTGIRWARAAGVDALGDPALASRLAAALRAPVLTALPDGTFPARKDSRFAVSLAQPMYLDLWERGIGMLEGRDGADLAGLGAWVHSLYDRPAPAAHLFDSCLHEAGMPAPGRRTRADLPWTSLLEMAPELPNGGFAPGSVFLPSQGLAILHSGGRYVSLECGPWVGGHGHPDRLHLTVHAGGVHWLPDVGTGSYVDPSLFWYRSTLAHNAPRLDGVSQQGGDAECEAFDVNGGWSWARGRWGEVSRTVVSGPEYLVDLVQLGADEPRLLELPWHLPPGVGVDTPGRWEPAELVDQFAHGAERFIPAAEGAPTKLRGNVAGSPIEIVFAGGAELIRALAPGPPGSGEEHPFFLQRLEGRGAALAAAIAPGATMRDLRLHGTALEVETAGGTHMHAAVTEGWEITGAGEPVRLGGLRSRPADFEPLVTRVRHQPELATAAYVANPPRLDGTLAGFEASEPIRLDHEDQYRRSEEPYAGPDDFRAEARVAWDADNCYLAVEVEKDDVWFRPADAAPLLLDNEVDDIHSDGLQVYLRWEDRRTGLLIVPEAGGSLRVRAVGGSVPDYEVQGSWQMANRGYRVTLALAPEWWAEASLGREVELDLIVNEMRPGRERRAGQLVWTGGGGWVWLRGDRQDPSRFGRLLLA